MDCVAVERDLEGRMDFRVAWSAVSVIVLVVEVSYRGRGLRDIIIPTSCELRLGNSSVSIVSDLSVQCHNARAKCRDGLQILGQIDLCSSRRL